jgi:hypothetical protein
MIADDFYMQNVEVIYFLWQEMMRSQQARTWTLFAVGCSIRIDGLHLFAALGVKRHRHLWGIQIVDHATAGICIQDVTARNIGRYSPV